MSFITASHLPPFFSSFFFNVTATTEIYTLSLHDALPIFSVALPGHFPSEFPTDDSTYGRWLELIAGAHAKDRKSTRLSSSHITTSYAVFPFKKKTLRRSNHSPS